MKASVFPLSNSNNKRNGGNGFNIANRKQPRILTQTALLHILPLGLPLVSAITGSAIDLARLEPDRPYTIGRTRQSSDFLFDSRLVSKQHCQILFDSKHRKIYIIDGAIVPDSFSFGSVVDEFRRKLLCAEELEEEKAVVECYRIRNSLNGVFVNGVRIRKGIVSELGAGDTILLVCGSAGACNSGMRIGFVIQGIIFKEEVAFGFDEKKAQGLQLHETVTYSGHSQATVSSGNRNKRVFALKQNDITSPAFEFSISRSGVVLKRMDLFLHHCRNVLHSTDPISCIRQLCTCDFGTENMYACTCKTLGSKEGNFTKLPARVDLPLESLEPVSEDKNLLCEKRASKVQSTVLMWKGERAETSNMSGERDRAGVLHANDVACDDHRSSLLNFLCDENATIADLVNNERRCIGSCPMPGKKFYLNRLQYMDKNSSRHCNVVSLQELIHPVENVLRIFIATFTSDILWFLSSCEIPCYLPVTITCHNTERCWSSHPERRSSIPYGSFPNLVVVFPPFPEAIAFGKDRKKQGIACHHPKLLVLQREDSIRVIITSANLVAKQWNDVTNTVWWQDFPRINCPDYLSLFTPVSNRKINQGSRSDFASQLAGFMASLVIDVPSQAHWIVELTNYDFRGAAGHLVASVPGIHSYRTPHEPGPVHSTPAYCSAWPSDTELLGSVEASVVGLSHIFGTATDSNGAQLKRLAYFLGSSCENGYGMLEVVLRRNTNVPVDANAVSIFVPNPDESRETDCIPLGFLPRNVAKWVSPLWDVGFFRFRGYVYRKEALEAAFGGNKKVKLTLHVSQGPCFSDLPKIQSQEVVALCSLIASIQRCTGLWRLQEVLSQYEWPESQESDFVYGSSSVGSVNAEFLAAFSAAAGKKALQLFESEESDPEWACWSASHELKSPSIRIIFPTIERVKNAHDGVLPSKRILCFSERTWQRLKYMSVLHDAIPHPYDRVGYPMHAKVARRRFQSNTDTSFGWVYCGSHNFSAAAWGRSISSPSSERGGRSYKPSLSSGSRLHLCNYELGIIFVFPPPKTMDIASKKNSSLDDITLPFVVPPPKYGPSDSPATARAMREALAEQDRETVEGSEIMEENSDGEVEVVEDAEYIAEERPEEKVYAEKLWSQVDSTQSC